MKMNNMKLNLMRVILLKHELNLQVKKRHVRVKNQENQVKKRVQQIKISQNGIIIGRLRALMKILMMR